MTNWPNVSLKCPFPAEYRWVFLQFDYLFWWIVFFIDCELFIMLFCNHLNVQCSINWWPNLSFTLVSSCTQRAIYRSNDDSTCTEAIWIERIGCFCVLSWNLPPGNWPYWLLERFLFDFWWFTKKMLLFYRLFEPLCLTIWYFDGYKMAFVVCPYLIWLFMRHGYLSS